MRGHREVVNNPAREDYGRMHILPSHNGMDVTPPIWFFLSSCYHGISTYISLRNYNFIQHLPPEIIRERLSSS